MAELDTTSTAAAPADVLNALLRSDTGSTLAALRAQRPEATAHTQGSYQALFSDTPAPAVSLVERLATALRVSALHQEPALRDHYATRLRATPGVAEVGSTARRE